MSDVEIFRAELSSASSMVGTAVHALLTESADLDAEDLGIQNPAHRALLRLEVARRLRALRSAVSAHVEAGGELAASAQRVADRYTDLDVELTGVESG
ncbi:hypothetical protein [Microbacterium sp. SD291]|uniref:hypothetical protein n=1 Tax=Microbacterium sp. SD291 TaxID=2782007 RepID=UPI001A95F925|nr:hypothetical protein [Microbacterium sp. SD291]MBO0981435.1 hypothetical protein [Microbacterium sp. SD291]